MAKKKHTPPIIPRAFWRAHKHQDAATQMLQAAREFGSFVKNGVLGEYYFVADADAIQHILVSDRDHYEKTPFLFNRMGRLMGQGLLTNLTESWLPRRKLLQKLFTREYLNAYAQQTIDNMPAFLEDWEVRAKKNVSINVYDEMMMLILMNVCRHFLSDTLSRDKARRLVKAVAFAQAGICSQFILSPYFPTPTFLRFRYGVWKMDQYVTGLIEARQRMTGHSSDLLTLLMEQGISQQEMLDEGKTFIVAGHETTGTALTWCFHLLMKHQAVYQQLQEEVWRVVGQKTLSIEDLDQLPFVQAVLEESLRLYPPIWGLPRRLMQPDTLLGYDMPKGAHFIISPYAMHRLEKYWDEPDVFNPARFMGENRKKIFNNAYLPFSLGPHRCIAAQLALRQAQIVLAMIAQRFSLERVSINTDPMPQELHITMRPLEAIMARVILS